MFDLGALQAAVAVHGAVARLVVASAKGSVPRAEGTSMLVWSQGADGSIGGGRLEHEAMARARARMPDGAPHHVDKIALGPQAGQCCGGSVVLVTEYFDHARIADIAPPFFARAILTDLADAPPVALRRAETGVPFQWRQGWLVERVGAPGQPVVIYGAGHVGRALAAVLEPLPDYRVRVADTRADWRAGLPHTHPDPVAAAQAAEDDALHLIMTHDHALDLQLCHILLQRRTGLIGLIGSQTKWARFRTRLRALGHSETALTRITCPIGDPSLGKHPQAIALGVAHRLMQRSMGMEHSAGEVRA